MDDNTIRFQVVGAKNGFVRVEVWDHYARWDRVYELDIPASAGVGMGAISEYTRALVEHIKCVREAGQRLGVPGRQLHEHDASKFRLQEFVPYARHFYGDGEGRTAYAQAWLSHLHLNPHHWQHWLFPDGYTPDNSDVVDGALPMPHTYLLEMVADWMGASRAYTGSEDMTTWLQGNMHKIHLHPATGEQLREILSTLGYHEVVYQLPFAHEL